MKFDDQRWQRAFDEGGIDPNNYDATLYWAAVAEWYESKNAQLEAALRKYGEHKQKCDDDPRPVCTCGLDHALAGESDD